MTPATTGVSQGGNDTYAGPAFTVGAGVHGIRENAPGWFADVHYLTQGSFGGGTSRLLQIRAGVVTP
jgi:hypothetical protein